MFLDYCLLNFRECKMLWLGLKPGARKFDCITPILKQLQWLPVARQLVVRDAVISFKCLHELATAYLCCKFIVLDTETAVQISYRPAVICIQSHSALE